MNFLDAIKQATDALRGNRLDEAESIFRQIIAERPSHPDALHLLGCTLAKRNQIPEALDLIRRAVTLDPNQPAFHTNFGLVLLSAGHKEQAIVAFSHSLKLQPNQPNTLNLLGNALSDCHRFDEAIPCFQRAIQLNPSEAGLFYNLGNCFFRRSTSAAPGTEVAGPKVQDLGNAINCFQKALDLFPRYTDAGNNLGNALRALGRMDEAIAIWRRTTTMGPHFFANYNLGRALYEREQLDDAFAATEAAIRLNPNYPDIWNNYGNLYRQSGKVDQAITQFDKALELDPTNALAWSNKLYTLYYLPGLSASAIIEHHRQWNDRVARPLAATIRPHANDRSPTRRLKIGYVSPNFWGHCQSLFTAPLFSNHNREAFEIYIYCDVKSPDAVTRRLRDSGAVWRNIVGLTDDQAADLIRADAIDILVDLTLHMAENRILLFARKPAPIQITWLGYPGTTGLQTMDYRLTDPYLDPPGSDPFHTEISIRLPHTFWCLDPSALEAPEIPEVNPLPATTAGHITFGCFNSFCKVNQPLLDLWKRVLDAVPNSEMLILAPPGSARIWVRQTLGDRAQFVGRENRPKYLAYHHHIDIGLDTLPYNGHTTTLDALWMGVPVITLVGETIVGRAGLSQLSNVGLEELITKTPDDFVARAAELAADLPRLTEYRRTLRQRLTASPLLDGANFTKAIEAAYRQVWQTYCADPPVRTGQ